MWKSQITVSLPFFAKVSKKTSIFFISKKYLCLTTPSFRRKQISSFFGVLSFTNIFQAIFLTMFQQIFTLVLRQACRVWVCWGKFFNIAIIGDFPPWCCPFRKNWFFVFWPKGKTSELLFFYNKTQQTGFLLKSGLFFFGLFCQQTGVFQRLAAATKTHFYTGGICLTFFPGGQPVFFPFQKIYRFDYCVLKILPMVDTMTPQGISLCSSLFIWRSTANTTNATQAFVCRTAINKNVVLHFNWQFAQPGSGMHFQHKLHSIVCNWFF